MKSGIGLFDGDKKNFLICQGYPEKTLV